MLKATILTYWRRCSIPNYSPIILSLPTLSMSRAEMMLPGRTDRLPRKLTR